MEKKINWTKNKKKLEYFWSNNLYQNWEGFSIKNKFKVEKLQPEA